jgi:tRNA pseudouridine32 synthase/23S rRNA pseudouridine746 synthase
VPEAQPYRPPPDDGLEPVHLDSGFVVLVKPAGLLSEPGRGDDKHDSLLTRAQARWAGARIVHRLDMMTSGVMVLARDAAIHARLSAAFRERRVGKRYEALVHGPWRADGHEPAHSGEIDLPITVDWPNRPRQVVCRRNGKPSLTRYRVLDAGGPPPAHLPAHPHAHPHPHLHAHPHAHAHARVALEPVTGRTHQLRVHLAALGRPIVGDPFYGRPGDPAPRMMLHATALAFEHPATGSALLFESTAPF